VIHVLSEEKRESPAADEVAGLDAIEQQARELAELRGYRVEHNADGSAIIKLERAVKVGDTEITRLTIPRITGRHLRKAQWTFGSGGMQLGALIAFTADVVLPAGAVDELDAVMARNVATEVLNLVGKSQGSRAGGGA
jgi:hypothetical protein